MPTQSHMTIDELIENFEFLGDWEQRFTYLIDLGKKLEPLDDADKVEANRVRGCQATVWMKADVDEADPPHITFQAESDAHIVNGLIAILKTMFSGKTGEQIRQIDAESVFQTLGLEQHLSPTRRNGLHAMLKRIRTLAGAEAA